MMGRLGAMSPELQPRIGINFSISLSTVAVENHHLRYLSQQHRAGYAPRHPYRESL